MGEKQRLILLPVDCSIHSERAFTWYVDNMYKPGDGVGIVHIHEPPSIPTKFSTMGPMVLPDDWKNDVRASLAAARDCAEKYRRRAEGLGIRCDVFFQSVQGSVGESICEIATKSNADGVIIGSRGLNGLRRTLLGSVSQYVITHCKSTVTVTPPPVV